MKKIMAICSLLIVTAVITLAFRYSISVAIELAFWTILSGALGLLTHIILMIIRTKKRFKKLWAILPAVIMTGIILINGVSMVMFKWEIRPVEQKFIDTCLNAKRYSDGVNLHYGGKVDAIKIERNFTLKKWGRFISSGDWHTEERTGPVIRYTTDWNPIYWWFHNPSE
ncbi:MAG: hypothetical protein WCP93_01275 [Candidatus Berkelbacteria bacterium]